MEGFFDPAENLNFQLTTEALDDDIPLLAKTDPLRNFDVTKDCLKKFPWVKDFYRYLNIPRNSYFKIYDRISSDEDFFFLVSVADLDDLESLYLVKLVQKKFSLTSRVLLKENDGEGDCCGQILLCGDYLLVSSPSFVHLFRREDLKCVQSRFDIGSCRFDPVSGTIVALDHSHHGVDGILYRPTRLYGLAFPSLESAALETSCSEGILSTVYQSSTTYKMHPYDLDSPAGTEDMAIDDSGRIFLLEKKFEEHCYLHVLAPDFSLLFSSKALVGMNSYSLLQGPDQEIILMKNYDDNPTFYTLSLNGVPKVK